MNRSITAALLAGAVLVAGGNLLADEGADLLKAKGCLNCHDMEKKKAGPAIKDIAAKHKGEKDAADKVTAAVVGGKHPKVKATEAEAKQAVTYILSK